MHIKMRTRCHGSLKTLTVLEKCFSRATILARVKGAAGGAVTINLHKKWSRNSKVGSGWKKFDITCNPLPSNMPRIPLTRSACSTVFSISNE